MANFQIRLDMDLAGQVAKNVTYWVLPDGAESTLEGLANSIRASFVSNVIGSLASGWTLNSITARRMDGGGAFSQVVGFSSGSLAGTATGEMLPRQTALLVSLSALAARPNRGRIYFAGLTEDSNTAGAQVLSTTRDTFGVLVTAWVNGLATGAGNANLVIARPDFTLNTWTASNSVDFVLPRTQWATQRRRRPGVGV